MQNVCSFKIKKLPLHIENQILTTMKTQKLFYIGERINPQFAKSYFIAYGQLTKKEALKKENCSYGGIYLTSYNTKDEYVAAKEKLYNDGFRVSNHEEMI